MPLISNLLKQENLNLLSDIFGMQFKRLKEPVTDFDKELERRKMTESEFKYYKKIMEKDSTEF